MQMILFIVLSGLVCSGSGDTKITNGTPVPEYKDASIALLTITKETLTGLLTGIRCAGTIIDKYNVMTSCNCIRKATTVTVRIGTVRADLLGLLEGGKEYTVLQSETFCHEGYNHDTSENDIGMIRILLGMDLEGSNAKAIELPGSDDVIKPDMKVDVLGWGRISDDGPDSDVLLTANVPVVDQKLCDKMYSIQGIKITDKMMCAGEINKEDAKSACFGEAGGPAMLEKTNKQLGIFSFGFDCGGSLPIVYMRVSALIPWIKSTKYSPQPLLPK